MTRPVSHGLSTLLLWAAAMGLAAPGTARSTDPTLRAADSGPRPNVVLQWNGAALEAIRVAREPPMRAARALAILHTCIHDARAPYRRAQPSPTGRSRAHGLVAISAAAHAALVDLFPAQQPSLFDPLLVALGADDDGLEATKRRAAADGRAACAAVLDARHHDGANQLGDLNGGAPYSDYTAYIPVNTADLLVDPNRWQPLRTPSGAPQIFAAPHWAHVTPFALHSADQFRPAPPATAGSFAYLQQARDIVALSAALDDRTKAIAVYWADGPGTDTPPGHWNRIAQWVSQRDGHDVDDDVRLFFVLNSAMLDASIAVWDAKVFYDSVRPVTAIRYLFAGQTIEAWAGPGLGTRPIPGARFQPYLPTPAFAEHPSGHSAFSSAAARVLEHVTGSPAFGATTVVPAGSSFVEPGLAPARDVGLSWPTFADAADQAGLSRLYGGIHFEAGDRLSRQLGRAVADQVWEKATRLRAELVSY
jgi:hypothetical protein